MAHNYLWQAQGTDKKIIFLKTKVFKLPQRLAGNLFLCFIWSKTGEPAANNSSVGSNCYILEENTFDTKREKERGRQLVLEY